MVSYSSRTAIGEGGVDSEPTHLAAAVRHSIEKQSSPANLSQKVPYLVSILSILEYPRILGECFWQNSHDCVEDALMVFRLYKNEKTRYQKKVAPQDFFKFDFLLRFFSAFRSPQSLNSNSFLFSIGNLLVLESVALQLVLIRLEFCASCSCYSYFSLRITVEEWRLSE
uniref:RGS domain-containing protein n=1 Tax=Syphacia muris TaxID=451379 RepID=A0A0N5B1N5_9BILA